MSGIPSQRSSVFGNKNLPRKLEWILAVFHELNHGAFLLEPELNKITPYTEIARPSNVHGIRTMALKLAHL